MTTSETALGMTVAINAGALVWGAATMNNQLRHLQTLVTKLEVVLERMAERVETHAERIIALETVIRRPHA